MTIDIPQDKLVAGVDEVGRGPLVGDVVTAAVILDPANPIEGLADSKKLSEKKRLALYGEIKAKALAWSIGRATPDEIDQLNILHATMLAMQRAVAGLSMTPELVFIDGNRCPALPMEARAVVKGDSLVAAISAASILAKVTRDAEMTELTAVIPSTASPVRVIPPPNTSPYWPSAAPARISAELQTGAPGAGDRITMADPRFVHLRVHSDFSMVDGLQIGLIVSAAAANNMPALALTDQMNMCGLVRFYGSAHGKGIKPWSGRISGVQSDELGDEQFRLTLLAMDNDGYQNITLLISRGYQRGHVQGRPVIDKGWLVEHAKGVIVLSKGGREGDWASSCSRVTARWWSRASPSTGLTSRMPTTWSCCVPVVPMKRSTCTWRWPSPPSSSCPWWPPTRWRSSWGRRLRCPRDPGRHPRRLHPDGQAPSAPLQPAAVPAQPGRNVRAVCRHSRGAGKHGGDRQALQRDCASGRDLPNFPTGDMSTEDFLVMKSKEGLEDRLAFLFPDPEVRAASVGEYDERLDIELKVINQMGFPGYILR